MQRSLVATIALFSLLLTVAFAQDEQQQQRRTYPDEIRGYKVELAKVEIKKPKTKKKKDKNSNNSNTSTDADANTSSQSDQLIQLGDPRVAMITPLGVTLEVPITVAPIEQGGKVDFLTFENMVVNGNSVEIEDYNHSFNLPNDKPLVLPQPIRIFVSTPQTITGVIGELSRPKDTWPVTGTVYVFGHFKKFLLKWKRVVPVEINMTFPNPLRNSRQSTINTNTNQRDR